jgi:hypothetical protein
MMTEDRELSGEIGREDRVGQTDALFECSRQMRVEERKSRDPHTRPSDDQELGEYCERRVHRTTLVRVVGEADL